MDCEDLRKRYEQVKSDRTTIQNTWDEIEKYVAPYRGEFFTEQMGENQIQWRQRQIFDSTAIDSAQTLAASIHGSLTSFVTMWFNFRFRQKELRKLVEAQRWLENNALICYHALQDSDFSLEISESYLDLVSFGTSTLTEEEILTPAGNHESLDFQSIPLKHSFFEVDAHGKVLYFYKRLLWTPLQIMDKFGKENVPDDILELAGSAASTQRLEIVFAVYPRAEYKSNNPLINAIPTKRPFGFKYFMHRDCHQLGDEGGYYEMPAFVPKWRKTNDSMWGNSPGMVQLSNIKTLNDLTELTLSALGKVVDPATIVTERGLLSDLDLGASGLTVVRSKDDLWSYESRARFDAGDLKITDLRNMIQKAFFVDQLELKQSPAMSATEANIRYELMQRLLGPTLGRLQADMLDPLLERTFKILYRAGRIPPPPQEIEGIQPDIDIEYVGPLPKAQRAQTAMSVESWLRLLNELGPTAPEVLEVPDWHAVAKELGNIKGVPAEFMKTEGQIRRAKRKREKQQGIASDVAMQTAKGEMLTKVGEGAQAINDATVEGETSEPAGT